MTDLDPQSGVIESDYDLSEGHPDTTARALLEFFGAG